MSSLFTIFIAFSHLTFINAQLEPQTLELYYDKDPAHGQHYSCFINRSSIDSAELPIKFEFISNHSEAKGDDDVEKLSNFHFFNDRNFFKFKNHNLTVFPRGIMKFAEKFKNLKKVEIKYANVERISYDAFENCEKLKEIFFLETKFLVIHDETFKNCLNLEILYLWHGELSEIRKETFEGLEKLRMVELAFNKIKHLDENVFEHLKSLEFIGLGFNQISQIPPNVFKCLTSVSNIDLHGNQISELPLEAFSENLNLTHLTLCENKIQELPIGIFKPLKNLITLFVERNKIKKLSKNSFGYHPSLKSFNIRHNKLIQIEPGLFESFPNLEDFLAQYNPCVNQSIFSLYFNINKTVEETIVGECYENWNHPERVTEEPIKEVQVQMSNGSNVEVGWFGRLIKKIKDIF